MKPSGSWTSLSLTSLLANFPPLIGKVESRKAPHLEKGVLRPDELLSSHSVMLPIGPHVGRPHPFCCLSVEDGEVGLREQ